MTGIRAALQAATLAVGLSGALFVAQSLIPWIGPAISILSALPIAWVARTRPKAALAAAGVTGLALTAAFGTGSGIGYMLQYGLGGVVLGLGIGRGWSPVKTVGGYTALFLAAFTALLVVMSLVEGLTPAELAQRELDGFAAQLSQAAEAQGAAGDPETVKQWTAEIIGFIRYVFWGLLASFGIFVGWTNAMMLKGMLKRRGVQTSRWIRWRAPDLWVWGLIGAGLLAVSGLSVAVQIGLNALIVAVTVYFLQGLAILQFLFEVKSVPVFLHYVVYGILAFQPPLALIVAGLGVFDLWLDFRARLVPAAEA